MDELSYLQRLVYSQQAVIRSQQVVFRAQQAAIAALVKAVNEVAEGSKSRKREK